MSNKEEKKRYYELAIILPMLLIILEKDYMLVHTGEFKLKEPYELLIVEVRRNIEHDLQKAKAYMVQHNMYVTRNTVDELFTEYHFHEDQQLEIRRYSNIRLRNQCADLLKKYLHHVEILK